jgi:PPOX class probable F420-dependent enzyme
MAEMTAREVWDFLMKGTRTAHVATVRADGRPHVKPVWFVLDGEPGDFQVLFNTGSATVKGRTLRADSRVARSVDDPTPPYSFVVVEGTAELSSEVDEARAAATRIGGRYMGADRAQEYGERNGVPGEYLVRVIPSRVIAQRDLAD